MSDNNDDPLDPRVWPMNGARDEVSLPEGSERAVERKAFVDALDGIMWAEGTETRLRYRGDALIAYDALADRRGAPLSGDSRERFETWYAATRDLDLDPIGSRECFIAWQSWRAAEAQRPSVAGVDFAAAGVDPQSLLDEAYVAGRNDALAAPRPPAAADEREAVKKLIVAYGDAVYNAAHKGVRQVLDTAKLIEPILAAFDAARAHPVAPAATQDEDEFALELARKLMERTYPGGYVQRQAAIQCALTTAMIWARHHATSSQLPAGQAVAIGSLNPAVPSIADAIAAARAATWAEAIEAAAQECEYAAASVFEGERMQGGAKTCARRIRALTPPAVAAAPSQPIAPVAEIIEAIETMRDNTAEGCCRDTLDNVIRVLRADAPSMAAKEEMVDVALNASRYVWLRQPNPLSRAAHIAVLTRDGGWVAHGDQCDAAIDAAMLAEADRALDTKQGGAND